MVLPTVPFIERVPSISHLRKLTQRESLDTNLIF